MEEAVETTVDNRGQWFVVHTLSGHENKVRDTILRQIRLGDEAGVYDAYIPTEKVAEVRHGEKRTITRKFFPGYILVRMDLYNADGSINEGAWYLVRSVQGVLGFLGGANTPLPLSESEVADIMRPLAAGENEVKPKISYEVGEVVRIKDGAFENFEGQIQEIDQNRGKLKLMVTIFGRSTPVELEFWQVERIV
jgi:transcriptional antiterminator NusG